MLAVDASNSHTALAGSVAKHTFANLECCLVGDAMRGRAMTDTLIDYSMSSPCCESVFDVKVSVVTLDDNASEATTLDDNASEATACDDSVSDVSACHDETSELSAAEQVSLSWADMDEDSEMPASSYWAPTFPVHSPVAPFQNTSPAWSTMCPDDARRLLPCWAKSLRFGAKHQVAESSSVMVPTADADAAEGRTSIRLSGLPMEVSRDVLLRLLESKGLSKLADFLYVPVDLLSWINYGYAFLNFETTAAAQRAMTELHGHAIDGESKLLAEWCKDQGLDAHVAKHRNNSLMHSSVADEYKPLLFKNGVCVPFPAPTKRIQLQRLRQELRRRQTRLADSTC